ncbi:MAG TPA: peptidylprolyl isomerase, partial [Polyangiales bacterium]
MKGAAVCCLCALFGCSAADGARDSAAHGGGTIDHNSVGSVDGVGISAEEVARLASAGTLSRQEALARLEAQQLLAAEARRRGYDKLAQTNRVGRQALVQALLERDIESLPVDEDEVSAAYAEARARFEKPEKRSAIHVLAYLPKKPSAAAIEAGRAFTADAVQQLMAAEDRDSVLRRLEASRSPLFTIKVEHLPAVAHDGTFAPEFENAMFALAQPGVVPAPVKTEFGWHAILVTKIEPATKVPMSIARDTLRRELAISGRKQAVDALMSKLRDARQVRYAERVDRALASL